MALYNPPHYYIVSWFAINVEKNHSYCKTGLWLEMDDVLPAAGRQGGERLVGALTIIREDIDQIALFEVGLVGARDYYPVAQFHLRDKGYPQRDLEPGDRYIDVAGGCRGVDFVGKFIVAAQHRYFNRVAGISGNLFGLEDDPRKTVQEIRGEVRGLTRCWGFLVGTGPRLRADKKPFVTKQIAAAIKRFVPNTGERGEPWQPTVELIVLTAVALLHGLFRYSLGVYRAIDEWKSRGGKSHANASSRAWEPRLIGRKSTTPSCSSTGVRRGLGGVPRRRRRYD